jgi:hypothetical protein
MNIVIDNEVWCELEVEGSICKYKFFLLNIPCADGGHKKTGCDDDYYLRSSLYPMPPEVIEGEIYCDSNEDAVRCAASIELLHKSSFYEKKFKEYGNWWIGGMDMGLIFTQFNGEPMKFLHHTFESSFDEESLMQIQKKINEARFIFHYFLLPENAGEGLWEVEAAYEKILPEGDAELIWQITLPEDGKKTVSIWYR